MSLPVAIISSL